MIARGCVVLLFFGALILVGGCERSPSVAVGSTPQLPTQPPTGAVRETTFDDIKFEMEKTDPFHRSLLTDEVEQTFGHKIRIRGYMFPTLKKRGIQQFVLVRDNLECCFGPGAALFDCILVHMQPGKTAEYSIRPVAVEGLFSFEQFTDYDGKVRAIYRLDGEAVE